jgi:hypothetical protein
MNAEPNHQSLGDEAGHGGLGEASVAQWSQSRFAFRPVGLAVFAIAGCPTKTLNGSASAG